MAEFMARKNTTARAANRRSNTMWGGRYKLGPAEIMEKSGNFGMFIAQLKAVLFSYGFVAIATALILLILKAFMPLRVTAEEEDRGLDFVAHGEEAYDPMTN